ncbi:MAG: cob(I)yrinic acid a,c-diamide adenosyltransferase [Bacteroidales bacterium]|jgi:cob(I)alamin adenosyltransferase
MKIYTRTGDNGTTSLLGGKRVPKHHCRVEAYGSVDELISWLGLLRSCSENEKRKDFLILVQDLLMGYAAVLSTETLKSNREEKGNPVAILENEIDKMEAMLPSPGNFILPGGGMAISYCHIARCVCRRAERAVSNLNQKEKIPQIIIKFLNRLSDYLFVLARLLSLELDNEDIIWPRQTLENL